MITATEDLNAIVLERNDERQYKSFMSCAKMLEEHVATVAEWAEETGARDAAKFNSRVATTLSHVVTAAYRVKHPTVRGIAMTGAIEAVDRARHSLDILEQSIREDLAKEQEAN